VVGGAATIAVALAVICLYPSSKLSPPFVTVRYVQPDAAPEVIKQTNKSGLAVYSPKLYLFWASNHTSAILHLNASRVQIRFGEFWSNSLPDSPLVEGPRFSTSQYIFTTGLAPHQAAYGYVRLTLFEPADPWRIKFSISEELIGLRKISAGMKGSFTALLKEHRIEPPFRKGQGFQQTVGEVTSEELPTAKSEK
jgi:hypothetical protein